MTDSPAFIDGAEQQRGRQNQHQASSHNGGHVGNALVQEVSVSYTGVRGASPPPVFHQKAPDARRPIQVETGPASAYTPSPMQQAGLPNYLAQYERRISEEETVNRVSRTGRHETEFPVRIAYTNSPLSPSSTYSVPIQRSEASRRLGSSLGSLITETTEQHYEAYSTSSRQREMASSPATVNALAAQFEQTARQQKEEAQKNGSRRSPAQVVMVKPSPVYKSHSPQSDPGYDNRVHRVERQVFSPPNERSVLTSTLVDIEPPGYGRRTPSSQSQSPQYIQETIQEEYHTIKRYTPTQTHGALPTQAGVRVVPVEKVSHARETSRDSALRAEDTASSRAPSSASSRVLSPVRTVVERFESHKEEKSSERRPPMIDQIRQEIIMQSKTSTVYSDEENRSREQQQREEEQRRRQIEEENRRRQHGGSSQTTTIIEEETFEEIRIRRRKKQDGQKNQDQERLRKEAEERERIRIEEERYLRSLEERERQLREEERRRREEEIRIQEELHYRRELEIIEQREKKRQEEVREKQRQEAWLLELERMEKERQAREKAENERIEWERTERTRIEEDERIRIEQIEIQRREERRRQKEQEEERARIERERVERTRIEEEERIRIEQEEKRVEEERKLQERLIIEERRRIEEEITIERRRKVEEKRKIEEQAEEEERQRREEERKLREEERQREAERRRQEELRIEEERTKWEEWRRQEEVKREEERKRQQAEMEKARESTPTKPAKPVELPPIDSKMSEPYHSAISSRPGFNSRSGDFSSSSTTTYGSPLSGNRMVKVVNVISSSTLSGMSPFGQHAASSIRDAREREKKEMSDLNDRLASYIEKVRFLEAQNRKLSNDLDLLRSRWGKDTNSVRAMYESEIREAQKLIGETTRQRDELEKEIRRLIDEVANYRRLFDQAVRDHSADRLKIEELLEKLSKLEADINLLKRKLAGLEEEVTRVKKENQRMVGDLQRARQDLDQETLNRIDYQNQVQTLLEEIDFMRRVNDQEIRDLQAMASRDTTTENREYFKNELASAIRDIRQEYDQLMQVNRNDIESWYKLKVQEISTSSAKVNMEQGYAKEEVKRLRTQLGDLRGKLADLEGRNALLEKQIQELNYQLEDDQRSYESALNDRDSQIRKMREECQALMVELQMLLDTKQTLDAEIAIYRKMLEGEENRAGLRQLVEQVVKVSGMTTSEEHDTIRTLKSEQSSRTSFQRSAKGNVSIQEAAADGKSIVLENTHRSREEEIGGWKLKRKIDGKKEIVYTFPAKFTLRPQKTVKIFARSHGLGNGSDTLVHDGDDSFGTGSNVHTILYNLAGEERATLIERSSRD
ncbi:unnamed protein product, partial [Mesorhabditis spiculigera]